MSNLSSSVWIVKPLHVRGFTWVCYVLYNLGSTFGDLKAEHHHQKLPG